MRRYLGSIVLVFLTLILMAFTVGNALSIYLPLGGLLLLISLLLIYSAFKGFKEAARLRDSFPIPSKTALLDFTATAAGSVVTYLISVHLNLGPVIASGLVGVVAALFLRSHAVPIYCGSFAGMSSAAFLPFLPLLAASVIAAFVFVLTKDVFNGYGGKLGTIALVGTAGGGVLFSRPFLEGEIFAHPQIVALIIASVLGAVAAFVLSVRFRLGPVFGSGAVGVVVGILGVLSGLFFPEIIGAFGETLAVAAFGASFVGMASTQRLLDERFIALGGFVFALVFVFSEPYFAGAGGKLGTIAFASTLTAGGLRTLIETVFEKNFFRMSG